MLGRCFLGAGALCPAARAGVNTPQVGVDSSTEGNLPPVNLYLGLHQLQGKAGFFSAGVRAPAGLPAKTTMAVEGIASDRCLNITRKAFSCLSRFGTSSYNQMI